MKKSWSEATSKGVRFLFADGDIVATSLQLCD